MISAYKEDVSKVGSCNFCQRGEINNCETCGTTMVYPYRKVYVLLGNCMEVRICADCLKELKRQTR